MAGDSRAAPNKESGVGRIPSATFAGVFPTSTLGTRRWRPLSQTKLAVPWDSTGLMQGEWSFVNGFKSWGEGNEAIHSSPPPGEVLRVVKGLSLGQDLRWG